MSTAPTRPRRSRFACTALVLALALPTAGAAMDDEEEEEEEPSALAEYFAEMGNAAGIGLNGLLTFPADPFMSFLDPPDDFEDIPGHQVAAPILGFGAGTALAVYRAMAGIYEILLAPIPSAMVSPEPRIELIPGIEHEEF